jgi:hypothetical protein
MHTPDEINGRLTAIEVLVSKTIAKALHSYSSEQEKDLATTSLLNAVSKVVSSSNSEVLKASAVRTAQRILKASRSDSSVDIDNN